jgi:molybdenum cofactor sulfurtransferase
MNGRRLPLHWAGRLRTATKAGTYCLLDAAALASTSPLDLSDTDNAPDFVSVSFYKIFGFPDLGALIVRKESAHVFDQRRYFGGGTVEMVASLDGQWHQKKESSLHARLEDGTLPMRNILALGCAMEAHEKLFSTMSDVSKHTALLASALYHRMISLRHGNGQPICKIYKDPLSTYGDSRTQGAVVTFNLLDSRGRWLSNYELNRLASANQIHIRTGTLCNPGGMADALDISSAELKMYYDAGFRCGGKDDVRGDKAVGMARVSLGASSTMADVNCWIEFLKTFFVEGALQPAVQGGTVSAKHNYLGGLAFSLLNLKNRSRAQAEKHSVVTRCREVQRLYD